MQEGLTKDQRAAAIVKRTQVYSALWINPAFQEWKTNVVDKRLDKWQKDVMSGTVAKEDRDAHILAHQMVHGMFERFFNEMQQLEGNAREELKP